MIPKTNILCQGGNKDDAYDDNDDDDDDHDDDGYAIICDTVKCK